MESKRETTVINDIFAITSHCLLCGHLPSDKDKLLHLFKNVKATPEEIGQLAKDNKLKWLRAFDYHESEEDYNKNMSLSLVHYLTQKS